MPVAGTVLIAAPGWNDDRPGGASKLPTDFARFLADRGHAVTYLCPADGSRRPASETIDGVDVRRYPAPEAPSTSVRNMRDHWQQSQRIALDVERAGPVRALLGHTPIQYLAAARALAPSVRRCYAVHSPFELELREGATGTPTLKQRMAWRGAAWVERQLLMASDVVLYHSCYARQLMEQRYADAIGHKGVVLPGWVDDVRFHAPTATRDDLRRRLGAPWRPGVPTFFTLRRLVPRMGIDTLIDAAGRLAGDGRRFRLVIGGDGPQRPALEADVASRGLGDRVDFVGRLSDGDLADSFAAADCFVLPTRALECFGLIVLESFACGVPVVAVPVGSIPEVMGPDFQSWLADDNQAPALAARMADVLDGRLTADAARLRARASAFSFPTVAARHERVLLPESAGENRAARR
jgi:glycosyltransferase involved in cell wall biosynthesis